MADNYDKNAFDRFRDEHPDWHQRSPFTIAQTFWAAGEAHAKAPAVVSERVDHHTAPDREGDQLHGLTGIFDRAIGQDGRWGTYDIAELDTASLTDFVRSRGEVSTWGLHIILIMLGHDREGVE